MRNLFGFCIIDKNAESLPAPDGSEFIVRRVDEGMSSRLKAMEREDDNIQKAANFPIWLNLVVGILLMCGAMLFSFAIELMGEEEMTYEIAVSCGFCYFIGFGVGLIVLSILFFVLQKFKNRTVMNSFAVKEHEAQYERVRKEALESMLVPQNAVPMDVFSYPYTIKNGKQSGSLVSNCLVNVPVCAFRDGDALCLAGEDFVLRIPYDRISSVSRIGKKRMFVGWNKQEKCNKGAFKPYKIRLDSNGVMSVKFCYRVEIHGSETFELLIPPYEFETLSPLLGYKALTVIDVKQ